MRTFDEALRELAAMAGADAQPAHDDEHVRWTLYEASLPDPERRGVLQDALRGEANAPLVSAVVTKALELVPDGERRQWVDLLPPGPLRDFARVRATELGIWESLAAGERPVDGPAEIDAWSRWLQLRIAEQLDSVRLLEELSQAGATKRIRRSARERLRLLRAS
ncbi:hypothetical protein [Myceligenerans salitolerans]|uniref:Uncharacterized protein n=1 Tax=Myceligenerans salitolerans TaxID=1230528 RepID=A0ABS3I859_9MICO|nr:hypothetical protein [Myceligenerans salitolerans]MBO0609207.1 hypothetical protein [Myceligenerans salitolerans]